jgi:hypothetical protein
VARNTSIAGAIAALAVAGPLALTSPSAAAGEGDQAVNLGQMTLGHTYYNRPGASRQQHDADVAACAVAAGAMHSVAEVFAASPFSPSGGLYRVNGDPTDRNLGAASLENCMVVRGWRVVLLPEAEGKPLTQLPPAQIANKIAPWIGAAEPHGQIVRVWNNDAVRASNQRYSTTPQRTKRGQLSLIAGAPDLQELPTAPVQAPPSPWINPRWPRKALDPADLAALRPDAAVLMIQVKGIGMRNGIGVTLNREGPDKDTFPSVDDHAPDMLFAGKGWLFAHRDGDMFVFAVPAGRWRLYGLGATPTLNLCLGSPSFEVQAGEVVYAGSFDLSAEDLGPDLDLTPAKAWLAGQPRTARAAAYVNGSQGPCGDNTIYALEIKGAPFEPGYTWGSQAKPAPTTGAP